MNHPPSPRDIQRWYPERWSEIAGNSRVVRGWYDFLKNGGTNTLLTGPSRTGKTRTTALGIMAVMCPRRTPQQDPCGICSSCQALCNARENLNGLFSLSAGSTGSYFAVDCETVTVDELKELKQNASLEQVTTYIYLDEVAALGRRGLDTHLLKAIDETPAIWIASAIAVRKPGEKSRVTRTPGLSDPMLARFAIKVGTALPREAELTAWIRDRCREWEIAIVKEEQTLPLLIRRSRHRVGMLILVLAVAASRGRCLDPDDVEKFDFQAAD